jgi:hypothetical protein
MSQTALRRTARLLATGVMVLAVCDDSRSALASGPRAAAQTATRVNPDAALALEFTKRVEAYVELHKKAEAAMPPLPKEATPDQIDKHQRTLSQQIERLRGRVQPGDIFAKDIRAYFRRQLEGAFAGPEGRKLRGSIMDENPGPIRVRANGRYPDTVPLATMPPKVLAALPKLPKILEYRFIGERLILLDVPAHLVVDFIEDALPR